MFVGDGGVLFKGALHALLNELGLPVNDTLPELPVLRFEVEDKLELMVGNPSRSVPLIDRSDCAELECPTPAKFSLNPADSDL